MIDLPPKIKFSREDVLNAAFAIACESGLSAITARSVAERLGSSVGPLYANFVTVNDLIEAVVQRIFALTNDILAKQTGPDKLENIGKASLQFAREYPTLFRELALQPNPYMASYATTENRLVEAMAQAEPMQHWSDEERRRLLLKLRVFQLGLSAMVANGHLPAWVDDCAAADLLLEVGNDLVRVQEAKRREHAE